MFSDEIHTAFQQHAMTDFPEEAVGLVVQRGNTVAYQPLENMHETPEKAFAFDGKAFAIASEEGQVLSVLHSHTPYEEMNNQGEMQKKITAHPTKLDMILQQELDIPFGIGLCSGPDACSAPFYFGDALPIPELVGRQYMYNVRYCFSLMRDYYRTRENNPFTLHVLPTDNYWWLDGENVIEEQMEAFGFRQVREADVQVGDVAIMRVASKVPNHIAVLIEPQLIIHHLQDALSTREPIARWQNFIVKWVRHEKDF